MGKTNREYVDQPQGAAEAASKDVHSTNVMTEDDDDERLQDQPRGVGTRESQAREVNTREMTQDDERIAAFRQSVFSSALPDLPKIPGFHLCWLTTTNPRDSIAMRERLGYELLKLEEVPGFEHSAIKDGPYSGYIGVNEMVASKIPQRLYLAYMQEAHHNAPKAEEERLRTVTEVIAEQAAAASGKTPIIGDGTAALGRAPPRGKFED